MIKEIKNKILKAISDYPMTTAIVIIILAILVFVIGCNGPIGGRRGGDAGEMLTTTTSNLSATWTNYPIFSGSAILNKLVIGKAESGGQVAIYDTTSEPNTGSIVFFVTGSSAQVWELDIKINEGIMVNVTDQEHAMFYYTPD